MAVLTEYNKGEWKEFLEKHKHKNVFQSPELVDFYTNSKVYKPFTFFLVEESQLTGILCAILMMEEGIFTRFFSSRIIISGGPLVEENSAERVQILLKALIKKLKNKAIYIQFRNLFNVSKWNEAFVKSGFKHEDHLNFIVDLNQSEEDLWERVHSKRRNEIRKAKKAGVIVDIITNKTKYVAACNILSGVYYNAKLPFPGIGFFHKAWDFLYEKGILKAFGAYYEGILIGTMFTLCYQNQIYNWYAGSEKLYYNKNPNDIIPWEAILWAKNNGYNIFDFGGAGKPGIPYGVREYKKKFGGTLVNFGRFQRINNKLVYALSVIGFKIWQNMIFRK